MGYYAINDQISIRLCGKPFNGNYPSLDKKKTDLSVTDNPTVPSFLKQSSNTQNEFSILKYHQIHCMEIKLIVLLVKVLEFSEDMARD